MHNGCPVKAKHKNIVRFLGYCADTQGIIVGYDEKFVMAVVQQRLLCFEYMYLKGVLISISVVSSCGT